MVTIRDVMPSFELYQPSNTEDALELLDRLGDDTWVMAGGKDSLNWFKDRIARPKAVPVPRRIIAAEQLVQGESQSEETAALAGRVSVRGAKPLNFNHFKVPLLESLVKRAVRDAA